MSTWLRTPRRLQHVLLLQPSPFLVRPLWVQHKWTWHRGAEAALQASRWHGEVEVPGRGVVLLLVLTALPGQPNAHPLASTLPGPFPRSSPSLTGITAGNS